MDNYRAVKSVEYRNLEKREIWGIEKIREYRNLKTREI